MSMHVGFEKSGSDAKSDSSSPSTTWNVDSALSGATWASAGGKGSTAVKARANERTHHLFMAGVHSQSKGRKGRGMVGEIQYSRGRRRSRLRKSPCAEAHRGGCTAL